MGEGMDARSCSGTPLTAVMTACGVAPSMKSPMMAFPRFAHSVSCSAAAARKVSPGIRRTCATGCTSALVALVVTPAGVLSMGSEGPEPQDARVASNVVVAAASTAHAFVEVCLGGERVVVAVVVTPAGVLSMGSEGPEPQGVQQVAAMTPANFSWTGC